MHEIKSYIERKIDTTFYTQLKNQFFSVVTSSVSDDLLMYIDSVAALYTKCSNIVSFVPFLEYNMGHTK